MTQVTPPATGLQPYLQFQITPDHLGMLPTDQLVEIVTLAPHQVIPIPEMPPNVLGVYNWRGEIIWMLAGDGGALPSAPPTPLKHAIVLRHPHLQHDNLVMGLIVQHIHQIIWCDPDDIEAPPQEITSHPIEQFKRWISPKQPPIYLIEIAKLLTPLPALT